MDNPMIELNTDPEKTDIAELYEGLDGFNQQQLPGYTERRRLWTVRNDQGQLIAGLYARMQMNTLHVDYFWIAESERGNQLGSKLIAQVEAESRSQGIYRIYLDTYTFQAPGFYRKLGFNEVGRFIDFPTDGIDKVFFVKHLPTA